MPGCDLSGFGPRTLEFARYDHNGINAIFRGEPDENGKTRGLVIYWPQGSSTDLADYDPFVMSTPEQDVPINAFVNGWTGCAPDANPTPYTCENYFYTASGEMTLSAIGTRAGASVTGRISDLVLHLLDSDGDTQWCLNGFDFDLTLPATTYDLGMCNVQEDCYALESSTCLTPVQHERYTYCAPRTCVPAGQMMGCGDDTECGANEVCRRAETTRCACDGIGRYCLPRCTDDSTCAEAEFCAADGHCKAIACENGGCPDNFSCSAENTCLRTSCTTDAECAGVGFCVEGKCHAEMGYCID
ncbi:hypothetical protein DV096_19775 [Bradymonadaceae bacterium TMQ3]|nr:hypothetical protein DV096_19775 [Bradymonadaceae bacterium TMQ3]TXC67879.1 hypothetical protein FRC91_19555 [Bradymonadales bacterium TMQ1]